MTKKIAITGAGSEIGKAIIAKLSNKESGFILQSSGRKPGLEHFAESAGIEYIIIEADFKAKEQLENFCLALKETDILINVAGSVKSGLLTMLTDEEIKEMIDVNIIALISTCRAVIPYMSSNRKGCIVNISSVAASKGNRGQTVYAGTKGFVESFSRSLAAEYGSRGVRVNCIAPGPINAGNLKEILNYAPEEIIGNTLSKRLGMPQDVANLCAFLCSDDSEFINGQIIKTDGGFMKGIT